MAEKPTSQVWTPFGVSKVKTYKPVSFSVTNSVLGTFSPSTTSSNVFSPSPTSSNAATYKNSTYPSFGVSGISGSHSVPSSPSLSSKTNLRMENRDELIFPKSQHKQHQKSAPQHHQPAALHNSQPSAYPSYNSNRGPLSPSSGPLSPALMSPQSSGPFSPTLSSGLMSPPATSSWQRQMSAPGTPTGFGRHGMQNMANKSPRRNLIQAQAMASNANQNKGLSMFLKQQQRHMEPEDIAAGYASGGEGSRPTTPLVTPSSPQVGRATPIQATGRVTPAPINTGRTTPLNIPGKKPVTWGGVTALDSPGLTFDANKSAANKGNTTPQSPSKSVFGWTPQQSPAFSKPSSPTKNTPIVLKSIAQLERKISVNEDLIQPEPEPLTAPMPVPPLIQPLTLQPRPSTPSISKTSDRQINMFGRTTPVFGTSSTAPGERVPPLAGTATGRTTPLTGTATPFLKDVPSLDANSNSYKVNSNLEKFSPSSPTPLQISTQSVSHTAAPLLLSPGASERSITPRPFSPKPGVWTPGQDAPSIETDLKEREEKPAPPPPEESFAWKPPERSTTTTSPTVTTETTTTSTTAAMTTPTQWNGTISHFAETKSGLPPTQSATVTLLQKSREGQIPKGAVYVGSEETTEGDKIHTDTFYLLPGETKTETKTTVHEQPMYDGIGPVDNKTGMPVGFRKHVDEKNQHAWYKQMYSSLHRQPKDKKDSNPYRPTYKFPDNFDTQSEPDEPNPYRPSYEFPNGGTNGITNGDMRNHSPLHSPTRSEKMSSWSPPHASYRNQVYKVQPRSIEDYEPGKSSISATEKRISSPKPSRSPIPVLMESKKKTQLIFNPPIEKPGQYSKYTDSGREPEFKKRESTLSPKSDVSSHDLYLQVQKGGDIPTSGLGFPLPKRKERSHSASSASRHGQDRVDGGRSHGSTLDRRQRDEEAARRKAELQRYYEEEKRKKMQQEIKDKDARRHHDTFMDDSQYWMDLAGVADRDSNRQITIINSQKSPIGQDRFDELGGVAASALQRPKKKNPTVVRGKAKALYSFTAQNTKELSFRRHDTIYLLRQIDKNWYEGEHHGRIGMFPKNYVEVITSLDEARSAAWQREGLAKVRYNFNPQTHQEMKLLKGETIQLIRRIDENWMEGRVNDRQGIFPASYVEIITEPDTPLMTPTPSYATTPVPGSPGQLSPGASTISNGPAPTIPSAPISPSLSGLNQFSPGSSKSWDVRSPYSTLDRRGYNGSDSRYGTLDRDYSGGGGFTSGYDTDTTAKSYSNTLDRKSERSYTTGTLERDRGHLNVLGLAPSRPNGLSNGRTSPYPKDDVKNSYTRKYEERISTSKPDEGLYPPYRALYTYAPQNEDELELREGDIVYVMEKCDDGWYVGTSHRTKEFGTFPGNYVQRA